MNAPTTKGKSNRLLLMSDLAKAEPDAYQVEWQKFVKDCVNHYQLGSEQEFNDFLERARMIYVSSLWGKETRRYRADATTSKLLDPQMGECLIKMIELFLQDPNEAELDRILQEADPALPKSNTIAMALLAIYKNLSERPSEEQEDDRPWYEFSPKSKNRFLFDLVNSMASYWEEKNTDEQFKTPTKGWGSQNGKRVPITNNRSAEFVYDVVHALDPDALPAFKKTIEAVAKARKNRKRASSP